MKLSNLLDIPVSEDRDVAALSCDNRKLDAQTWWLAAKTANHHALDYYQPNQPCAGVIYEPPHAKAQSDWVAYPELGKKLGEIAARFYHHPSAGMQVLGVTGTDGKSSFVHMMAQIANAAMIGTIGIGRLDALNLSTHTTPDALALQQIFANFAQQGIKRVAMEVSSHALNQYRVDGTDFDIAVFTNFSRDHLDYHHDMEDYFLAKARLFSFPISHAVVNLDDEWGRRLITERHIHPQTKIWSVSSRATAFSGVDCLLRAENIALHHDGISVDFVLGQERVHLQSGLLGRFNVDNLLNVGAALLALGYTLPEAVNDLSGLKGVPGRVERIALGDGKTAIVDYAHTPGALENALRGIRAHVDGRLWVVFGCGGDRDTGKRPLMGAVAEKLADKVVLTDDNPRHEKPGRIIEAILAGMKQPEDVNVIQPREEAIKAVLADMEQGDAVLIAGKGHEAYQIIGDQQHDYSDQAVVQEWMAQS